MNLDGITVKDEKTTKVLEDNFLSGGRSKDNDLNLGINNSLTMISFLKNHFFEKFNTKFSKVEIDMIIRIIGARKLSFDEILNSEFKLGNNTHLVKEYLENNIKGRIDGRLASEKEIEYGVRQRLFNFFLAILEENPYNDVNIELYNRIKTYKGIDLLMFLWFISEKAKDKSLEPQKSSRLGFR